VFIPGLFDVSLVRSQVLILRQPVIGFERLLERNIAIVFQYAGVPLEPVFDEFWVLQHFTISPTI
jgi:hypothetical protein